MLARWVSLAVLFLSLSAAAVEVDPDLPDYEKSNEELNGSIRALGSDTLNNLITLWAETMKSSYPRMSFQLEGKGAISYFPLLLEGISDLGPSSRPIKDSEVKQFVAKWGYPPTEIRVAVDALGVFVHQDNPIKGLTLKQVDAIFSSTRKRGAEAEITAWGQVRLEGEWNARPITPYGRNSASGTWGFFNERVLARGTFKDTVKEQPSSNAVVLGVSSNTVGIGYSAIGYATAGVRAVPLAEKEGDAFVEATPETARSGAYPLARFLFIYIRKDPKQPLRPEVREFLRLVLSKQGQEIVVKDGYFPLTAAMAAENRKKLD